MKIQNHIFLTILAASCSLFCASCNRNDCPPPPQCPPQTNEATTAALADKPEAAPDPSENVPAPPSTENTANTNNTAQLDPSQNKDLQVDDKGDEKKSENDLKDNEIAANDENEVDNEVDEDSDTDEENCENNYDYDDYSYIPNFNELTLFGQRHEIQGELSEAKWADLEPTLPVSILKVSPDNNVIKKLESMFKYNCGIDDSKTAADGTSVQLIVCSKKDADVKDKDVEDETPSGHYYKEDKGGCPYEAADVAYLSLLSPKDHHTRVYEIDSNLNFGYDVCVSVSESGSLTLSDVEFRPFMDTKGLYVRTKKSKSHIIEHTGSGSDNVDATYTTWLFAGDNHRLVTNWDDTTTTKHDEFWEYGNCVHKSHSESYSESYMYYESGEFKKSDSKTANDEYELKELLIKRP